MHNYFIALLAGLLAIVIVMVITMFIGKTVYDKLNALFVINTNIVMLILVVGLIDNRVDMHIEVEGNEFTKHRGDYYYFLRFYVYGFSSSWSNKIS